MIVASIFADLNAGLNCTIEPSTITSSSINIDFEKTTETDAANQAEKNRGEQTKTVIDSLEKINNLTQGMNNVQ